MNLRKDRQTRLDRGRTLSQSRNLPGVSPASLADVLRKEAERPLRGGDADMQHGGLFGDAMKQRELF